MRWAPGWIVELFPWAYIEPRRNESDWAHSDHLDSRGKPPGVSVIARLDFVPDWARPPRVDATPFAQWTHWPDYVEFVATVRAPISKGDSALYYLERTKYEL